MSIEKRLIAIVGGTGAQGIPIVRELARSGSYTLRILTRDATSRRFQELRSCDPDIEAVEGTFASEADLRALFRGAWGAFVNIDGFNSGEMAEMFWTARAYELAAEARVQMFVYGGLDYYLKKGGYDSAFRVGHGDAKGRMADWILAQTTGDNGNRDSDSDSNGMKAAVFTTGPYIDMAISAATIMAPRVEEDEAGGGSILTWRMPLGPDGAVAHVALGDCGYYVKWLFEHPDRAHGLNLEVAIDHITYDEMARAFTSVTGRPARFIDVGFDEYFTDTARFFGDGKNGNHRGVDGPAGYNADAENPATLPFRQNFTGFWNVWRHSHRSNTRNSVVRRDYALLDEIHPRRIRSAEEWFRMEEQRGLELGLGSLWERVQPDRLVPVLKVTEEGGVRSL
ncbi:NmrA family protein [Apiospora arundinis]